MRITPVILNAMLALSLLPAAAELRASPYGYIGDRVWQDLDGDGIQDDDEPGMPGVTLRLRDCAGNVLQTLSSWATGGYSFVGLEPGEYVIEVQPPAGFVSSPSFRGDSRIVDSNPRPETGLTGCMPLADGQSRPGVDAGLVPASGQIGDRVWTDLNGDGLQGVDEPGLSGVTVRLQDCAGNVLASAASETDGYYSFGALVPGRYVVAVQPPVGYRLSPSFVGDSRIADSNPRPDSGTTGCMELAAGQWRPGIDVGLIPPAAASGHIGDRIWEDVNANGLQDPGEPGKSAVTLRLRDCDGTVLATTSSASDGHYAFAGLAPGAYRVEVLPPADFVLSPRYVGDSRVLDSNPHPQSGLTGCLSLADGQSRPGIDAGLIASLPSAQPNVLFVVIDDLNDFVGVLGGHPQASTPNIDTLAAQGINFTNAHVAGPSCNAARSSMLTGISPGRSGITANPGAVGTLRDNLPQAISLVRAFADAGYYTARYGKVFHGDQEDADWDFSTGSSEAFPPAQAIPLSGLDFSDALPFAWQWDWGPLQVQDAEVSDYSNADKAIGFLDTWTGDEPFFLAVGFTGTHLPWYCPISAFDLIAGGNTQDIILPEVAVDDLDDVGRVANGWAAPEIWTRIALAGQRKSAVHSFLACGAFIDRQLGRLLGALDASPFGDNTIVVLLSDHGFHLGEKSTWNKFMLWEEDTRVPFVLRLPGGVAQQIDAPVNVSAVYPTLLDVANIPLPDYAADDPLYRIDYRSLVPLIDGGPWQGPAVSFNYADNVSIRSATHRFTLYHDGFVELYDHLSDPDEWNNLADRPEHQQAIADWTIEAEDYLSGQHPPF